MDDKTGGPAFPGLVREIRPGIFETISSGGMSLRDYFAAKALVSILSGTMNISSPVEKNAAEAAYRFADAMLKAREQY